MSAPVYNPPVPFTTSIQRLSHGSMIYVTGTPCGERFSINLQMGPGEQANNAFHFNPRFQGNTVVRNTKTGGRWGTEERQANEFPFFMGHQFEVIILCQSDKFKVAVNGRHFIEYCHRLPLQNISHLSIRGNVTLQMVRFDREQPAFGQPPSYMPVPQPSMGGGFGQPAGMMSFTNPIIPFITQIPVPNIRDRSVTIMGMPRNQGPNRMTVNFQTAGANPDTLFHFNPRFNERVIVRNAKFRGAWGPEERQLTNVAFPFQYNVPFQLQIFVSRQNFRVTLNGMEICTFAHRDRPLNKIRQLQILGSVNITQVQFN